MAEKPTIPDFPTLPDFGKMITQACEVVASVRGIPYDFNGTLSLENKFVVLFKTVKEMFDAQDNLVKSYKALYDFVNNYFTDLNVQDEINKKIQSMAEDGSLVTLIAPTVANATGKWLLTNITNPSNPPIDKSLTVENAAADAKITGNKIELLNDKVTKNSSELYYAKENEITVKATEYSLLENKVAYIDTTNKIATYDNTAAFVLKKIVSKGEIYRIKSQTHGSVNTLLYAICNTEGIVIESKKMGVPANTYITTTITIPENGYILYLNEFPTQTFPLLVNKIEIIYVSSINGNETISCWGDSLTLGVGVGDSYSKAYPYVLFGLLNGRKVINCGVGGENTITIASRQGGLPNIVQPFTIPSDSTKVKINLTDIYGNSAKILLQGGSALDPVTDQYIRTAQINPCIINSITGTVTYENGNYYFSRSKKGSSVLVTRPVPLITHAMTDLRDNINIIWIGTNGGFTTSSELIETIDIMIKYMRPITKKYIVIGLHHLTSLVTDSFETIEKNMTTHFGLNYINERKYILNYGLSDAGITPTPEDKAAISQGKVPPSLLYDSVHYNAKGYAIIANLVAERGKELGYWQ